MRKNSVSLHLVISDSPSVFAEDSACEQDLQPSIVEGMLVCVPAIGDFEG